jgi:hypothetical protein
MEANGHMRNFSVLKQEDIRLLILFVCAQLLFNALLVSFIYYLNQDFSWDLVKQRYSLWDGQHYLSLAEHGYSILDERKVLIVFLPLYPAFIKLFSEITHSYFVSGWLVSNLMVVVGHIFFYKTLRNWGWSKKTSLFAIWFLVLSPPGLYLCVIYTEGLFYGFLSIFLFLLSKKSYFLAAMIGLLVALTRQTGLMLVFSYFFVLLSDYKKYTKLSMIKFLSFSALIPVGYGFYLLMNWKFFNDPFFYTLVLKGHWYKEVVNPFIRYHYEVENFVFHWPSFSDEYLRYQDYQWLVIFPAFVLMSNFFKSKIPFYFLIWGVACFLVFLAQSYWLSSTRYIWMTLVFPAVLAAFCGRCTNAAVLLSVILMSVSLPAWKSFATGGWVF